MKIWAAERQIGDFKGTIGETTGLKLRKQVIGGRGNVECTMDRNNGSCGK